jgi:hypothetical protein
MLRYKDPKKKSGWIKALKKEINTIIESGILNKKEPTKPNDGVVSATDTIKIKLDQDENVDKSNLCKRRLAEEEGPIMEDPHSPAASMIMSKLLTADASIYEARIFQFDVIGAFL